MRGLGMIRKALLLVTTLLSVAVGVLFVLSFAIKTRLPCCDVNELTPQRHVWDNSEGHESVVTEFKLRTTSGQNFIVKDWSLATFWNISAATLDSSEIWGITHYGHRYDDGRRTYAQTSCGELVLTYIKPRSTRLPIPPPPKSTKSFAGFAYEKQETGEIAWRCGLGMTAMSQEEIQSLNDYEATVHALRVPLWFLFLLVSWYPVTALLVGPMRRRRRRKRNQCLNCAYDLTGNTTGTCPECGNEI